MNGTQALVGADRSAAGAVYKGLATVADRLYATDFHNAHVDVFDSTFAPVSLPGGFQDPKIAKGYAPFGIQALGGNVWVTYAKQDAPTQGQPDRARVRRTWMSSRRTASWWHGSSVRARRTHRRTRPGASRWRRLTSVCSPAICSSGTSATAGSAPISDRGGEVGLQGPASPRQRSADRRSTDCGRSRSATARRPVRRTRSTSTRGPERRGPRALRLDHRRLTARGARAALAQGRPPLVY